MSVFRQCKYLVLSPHRPQHENHYDCDFANLHLSIYLSIFSKLFIYILLLSSIHSFLSLSLSLPLLSDFYLSIYLSMSVSVSPTIYTGVMFRVFANGPGDRSSIPGRVMPKTKKMVLDATLLNTQYVKVQIKGKSSSPWKGIASSLDVVAMKKGAFRSPSTTVDQFIYINIYE